MSIAALTGRGGIDVWRGGYKPRGEHARGAVEPAVTGRSPKAIPMRQRASEMVPSGEAPPAERCEGSAANGRGHYVVLAEPRAAGVIEAGHGEKPCHSQVGTSWQRELHRPPLARANSGR